MIEKDSYIKWKTQFGSTFSELLEELCEKYYGIRDMEEFWESVSENPNMRKTFIDAHPEYPWHPIKIKGKNHPKLYEKIKRNPEYHWDFYNIFIDPDVPLDIIDIYLERHQDIGNINIRNNNIDFSYIEKHPELIPLVHGNPKIKIPLEYVLDNRDKPWNWNALSEYFPIDKVLKYSELFHIYDRDNPHNYFWTRADLTPDILETLPYINYDSLSRNKNLPFSYVLKNLDKPWNWRFLSAYCSEKDISDNLTLPWEKYNFFLNSNLSVLFIISHNPNLYAHIVQYILIRDKWDIGLYATIADNPYIYNEDKKNIEKRFDINWRLNGSRKILEIVSPFSRNIDKFILKRLTYR